MARQASRDRTPMILILSTPRDEHAQVVMAELMKLDAPAMLLDLSDYPQRSSFSMKYERHGLALELGCSEGGLDLDDCGAVWWRRPQWPEISTAIVRDTHRNFAVNECTEALHGLWQSLDARWINEPARDLFAQRKSYQLKVAQTVGLEVPDTLITNCPDAVREFVMRQGMGNVIFKSFSATEAEWRETRLLREEEMGVIDNVRYTPVIFQRYIEADVDLRITVVGDEIFAAAIHSQQTSYKVDFRMDIAHARIEAVSLPPDVARRLLDLMRYLGLVYGAIDMRRTPDGRYVFLEVNPAGQWLFTELPAGLPISCAIARKLREFDA
ncbi:MvdC/MvdD family ATP grasp protein [Paraburkholderia antibiotica]|uniref:Alpha-L-glutamate ligase n=1 Tax=Paraburkholderia antibiotica TaxID=2728839 RepID=A0A7X9X893_9BURK|nr:alpha-L-glutamate ligase [Paraburkholderia antibiotica]NML32757.1 alpha-L-glutamate ligase [Paraburkholderia antibiotica]